MTGPSSPVLLPDSVAAAAVAETRQYFQTQGDNLRLPELEKFIKQKVIEYGADPVTAASSARTVNVLATQNPANAQGAAEHVVGATIADPALGSAKIRDNVLKDVEQRGGVEKLSPTEQKAIAYEHASQGLKDAGVADTRSYQDVQTRIHQYIDQGVSPDLAASAAAAPALARGMPQVDSFSIFGYLTMLVHGQVEYTFKNTETLMVANSAIHGHLGNTTYQMVGHNFLVQCGTIQTSSTGENVRAHSGAAIGDYKSQYKALMGASVGLYLGAAKYGGRWLILAGMLRAYTGIRVYLAGTDSDVVKNNISIEEGRDHRVTLLSLTSAGIVRASSNSKKIK